MWHVSSHSDVATLRTAIHLLLTYLLIIKQHDGCLCTEINASFSYSYAQASAVYIGINTSKLSNIDVFIHFTCNFNQRHYHFNHKSRHTPSSESMCWSDDCRWWSFCFTLDLVGESFTTLNMDCDNPISSSTLRSASAVLAFNSWTTKQTDNKVSVSCQLPWKL